MSWLVSWLLFRPLFYSVLYGVPLLGFWVASSLAAYLGGPHWIPWAAGLLMFPVLPGLWELHAWGHQKPNTKPWFTLVDRIGMRTFTVGLLFLSVMLYLYPQSAFVSLSTRGDWMLDDVKDPRIASARPYLFQAAGAVEWLYQATKTNPYKAHIDPEARQRAEEATKQLQLEIAQRAVAEKRKPEQNQADQIDGVEQRKEGTQTAKTNGTDERNEHANKLQQNKHVGERKENGRTAGQSHSLQGHQTQIAKGDQIAQGNGDSTTTAQKDHTDSSNQQESNQKQHKTDPSGQNDLIEKGSNQTAKQSHSEVNSQKGQTSVSHQNKKASLIGNPSVKWPWPGGALHPLVSQMPASAEASIDGVAHYIADREPDPVLRIKALHDYVADRIAYDSESYYAHNIPPQDAEIIFKKRKGVCAGYANLMSALAAAIGEQVIVVSGDSRSRADDKLTGSGHAWNAARIGNRWCLLDACWDAGFVTPEKGFTKCYKSDYLLPPAEVMIQDHFPEQQDWQLLSKPLSQGDFLRQPMLRPGFQAADLQLIVPRRACTESGPEAMVIVKNPDNYWLMADLQQDGKNISVSCDPTNSETAQLICAIPGKGTYRFNVFLNKSPDRSSSYEFIGCVEFVNR